MKTFIFAGAVLFLAGAARAETSLIYSPDFKLEGTIITIKDPPPEPEHIYDWSGLSRLEFENGHPVAREAKPAAIEQPAPEPTENIIDALDEIRKEKAAQ